MFEFLLIFFIDIITPVISSTRIASDVMCVQHEFINFYIVYRKKNYLLLQRGFLQTMASTRKNKGGVSYLNQA